MVFEPLVLMETLLIEEQRIFFVDKLKLLILSIAKLILVTADAATVAGGFKGLGLLSVDKTVLSVEYPLFAAVILYASTAGGISIRRSSPLLPVTSSMVNSAVPSLFSSFSICTLACATGLPAESNTEKNNAPPPVLLSY